jgi:hypothetical protein
MKIAELGREGCMLTLPTYYIMGAINGKAGKAAALPKFSDTLSLSQP